LAECDVISVVTEFMVSAQLQEDNIWIGSRAHLKLDGDHELCHHTDDATQH